MVDGEVMIVPRDLNRFIGEYSVCTKCRLGIGATQRRDAPLASEWEGCHG